MTAKRECPASISGMCLQLTEGFMLCREGECDYAVIDAAADRARAQAEALGRGPVRRPRKPVRGKP